MVIIFHINEMSNKCVCKAVFKHRQSLSRHKLKCQVAKELGLSKKDRPKLETRVRASLGNSKCHEPYCNRSFKFTKTLRKHLVCDHNIALTTETNEFINYDDFLNWKEDLERSTVSNFLKGMTARKTDSKIEYFVCNRAGYITRKSTGKRKPKSRGVSKINENCTASIKAIINLLTGTVQVNACLTHYQHKNELCHIRMPKTDKHIDKRHDEATRLTFEKITQREENIWTVSSQKSANNDTNEADDHQYVIEKQTTSCFGTCQMKCNACNICIHTYTCTCLDALVRTTICKHVHLVALYNARQISEQRVSEESSDTDTSIQERQFLQCPIQTQESNIIILKESVMQELAILSQKLQRCNNEEIIKKVICNLHSANSLLGIEKYITAPATLSYEDSESVPHIEKQKRFFPTKKKLAKKNILYGKPTLTEEVTEDHSYTIKVVHV